MCVGGVCASWTTCLPRGAREAPCAVPCCERELGPGVCSTPLRACVLCGNVYLSGKIAHPVVLRGGVACCWPTAVQGGAFSYNGYLFFPIKAPAFWLTAVVLGRRPEPILNLDSFLVAPNQPLRVQVRARFDREVGSVCVLSGSVAEAVVIFRASCPCVQPAAVYNTAARAGLPLPRPVA
jgi:hypothetical protein